MIRCYKGMQIPTVEQTLSLLRGNLDIRPIYADYDKVLMNIYALTDVMDKEASEFMRLTGVDLFKETVLDYYANSKGFIDLFQRTDTGGISHSAESINGVLASERISDVDRKILNSYVKRQQAASARSSMIGLLQNPISKEISCDGHRMLELRPDWSAQNTGRVAMSNPAIQNLKRELQEVITVPYGYKLIHCDSGQVEPRITYSAFVKDEQIKALINLYNDAYFGLLHYCTMDQKYIDSGTLNFEKFELTDNMKANRQKIKTYGNAVMYGSDKEEDSIKSAMIRRIGNHPARLEMIRDIEYRLSRGETVFNTYFGTPIDITKSPKYKALTGDKMKQMIRLAVNNPIQGTAADLMRLSAVEANRLSMSTKKSSIIAYVHDAGLFCVHEDDYDKIGKELEDIVAYHVDDWIPVHAEAEVYTFNKNGAFTQYKY